MPAQQAIGDHQDRMRDRDNRPLLPPSGGEPTILSRQVGIFGVSGRVRSLNQALAQGLIAVPRRAGKPFAPAFPIPRSDPSPIGYNFTDGPTPVVR